MPRTIPPRPNLDQLKRQAKQLLKAYRAGDRDARQLFDQLLGLAPDQAVLAQALTVVAREHGFASWLRLKQHVEHMLVQLPKPSAAADRNADKRARKLAYQQRVAEIAEQLAGAARERDLWRLFATLGIGKRDGDAVRAYLAEHDGYSLIVDALLLAADHSQARLRFLAAQAMDHFADQRCAEPLRKLLHDPVPRVRWAALHSLGCDACKLAPLARADDFVETLIELALHDPSVRVRRVASYELGQMCRDPRALAALETIRATSADPTILREVGRALRGRLQL